MEDSSEEEGQACCGLWRRLGARGACARLRRRVAPETNQRQRSPRSRKSRINHPPKAQYSALGECVRVSAPAALQCALFCGGARCPYERPATGAIQGLYSDWITDDILAMARPSTAAIAARNIVQQFHSWGIRTVINLQTPGEHASCGPALTSSGFTYDPNIFMANDIYYYNFAWPDYGEASLSGLLDMAKVLSFALQEGRVAIHCHAALIALKVWLEPIKGVCRCKTKLHGKVALVTGGNSGIGLETAKDLAKRGARVIIASRDNKKSEEAVNLIKRITRNDAVEYRHLDLSKFKSIRRFCEEFNATLDRLDILVNNAGCGGVKGRVTEDGIDLVTQINYLGPFLLTNLLMKKLTESKPSRVVIVASYAGHFAKLDTDDIGNLKSKGYWAKYCNTKLCNILWAKALEKKLPKGVTANSLHPGVVKTAIFDRIPARTRRILLLMIEVMFKSAKEGAQTTIHLCVAPELENTSGKYYSDCKPARSPKEAKDEAIIDKVWRESIRLTGS